MPYQPNNNHNRDPRLKPRFNIKVKVRIKAQLIGTGSPLEFETINLSETGLLLKYIGQKALAFNESTILESWLYPEGKDEIFFFTKFVRYQDEHILGVRIIDIDSDAHQRYIEFLESHPDQQTPEDPDYI